MCRTTKLRNCALGFSERTTHCPRAFVLQETLRRSLELVFLATRYRAAIMWAFRLKISLPPIGCDYKPTKDALCIADARPCVYALDMANYTRTQFTRLDSGVSEEWRTESQPSATLAYVDYYDGAASTAQVFDPATGHSRSYSVRSTDRALAIVERHLERNGYKKCVEFKDLTGDDSED